MKSHGERTLSPFLTKTPTQMPLTVPNPRSRTLRMLSASVKSVGSEATCAIPGKEKGQPMTSVSLSGPRT